MGKSKIFIVSPFASLWRFNNGGTPTIYNLIKGLIDAGKEVHLVCPLNGNERVDMEGLRVHHFKMWTGAPWRGVRLLNLMYSKISIFLFVLLAWRKTMNVIKKNKPDIIYGLAGPGAVAAYLVARSKHIPNVTRLYGIFIHRFIHNPFQLLLRFDEVVAFKLPCKYLIITDDGTRGDDAARFFKVPPKRIKFWRNGVDDICDTSFNIEDFKRSIGIPKEKKIILSVSRLVKLKRVERIIEAIPEVALRHKESVFLIVGDGEKRSFLEQLARELNLGDHIKFIGAVPYAEVSKYMNSADIFISMNDVSNLGNSVLEAMRCGKCVVVFDTGATHKVVKNGENGLLLKAGGTKEVADALVQLLEDEKLRHTLGANARKYAQGHFQTWDERIRMEIKLIEEIIKKNGGK